MNLLGLQPISVVIPAHNSGGFIGAALDSIAAQSQCPREVIVVCDGCSDDTAEIAARRGARVIEQPQSGTAAARNAGIRAAREEWIALLDADDLWHPRKLETQLAAASMVDAKLCFSDYSVFDDFGLLEQSGLARHRAFRSTARTTLDARTIVVGSDAARTALEENYMLPSTLLVPRSTFERHGVFDSNVEHAEDFEWLLRVLREGVAVGVIEPLTHYRRHVAQKTSSHSRNVKGRQFVIDYVLERPGNYRAAEVARFARNKRWDVLKTGIAHVRVGEFGEARAAFQHAAYDGGGAGARTAAFVAGVLDNQLARGAHGALRAAWRRRPWLHPRFR